MLCAWSIAWIVLILLVEAKHVSSSAFTPKFAAESNEEVLNVHIVPHTHDDVGWLKTVEQYYYGRNNTIQHAAVKYILSTVMEALAENSNRTFTYVETKFFSMWWNEQTASSRKSVHDLIASRQLSFANGGWCMHDEATTHFMGMIDQTTLGHSFLKKELGVIPTVGWQLDPFGHSATQASLLTSQVGFDALYFGRIDYQDLALRHALQECEGLWAPTNNSSVFWGLTGSYSGNYGPPQGFCWDTRCQDEPLVGDDDATLLGRVKDFVKALKVQSDRTKGNHILLTWGEDFNYENAFIDYANLDLLISSIYRFQESGSINVTAHFESRFKRLAVFYSTPEYYTRQKYDESHLDSIKSSVQWSTKTDDFFPYSDCPHCFWTGYFTSRTGFKRLERVGSSFLQAARQLESMRGFRGPLFPLEDAMGIAQHHDAVSGTAKQHVTNDYAKKIQRGIDQAAEFVTDTLKQFLLSNATDLEDLVYCQLLNETKCHVSQHSNERDLYVIVYNGLAQQRSSVVGIPISVVGDYVVTRLADGDLKVEPATLNENGSWVLYFDTGPLPPIGASVFHISLFKKDRDVGFEPALLARRSLRSSFGEGLRGSTGSNETLHVSNGILSVDFNRSTGMIEHVSNSLDGTSLAIQQQWGYYTSFDSKKDKSPNGSTQNSGAYIFRPSEPTQKTIPLTPAPGKAAIQKTNVGVTVHAEFEQAWIKQTTRLFANQPYVEVEYTIGPVPIHDGVGKEIITRLCTPLETKGHFYTDSNGREFLKRTRGARPSWDLTEYEPVAGNYYPVNAAIYIEDESSSALSVVVDRTQGGASLSDGCIELMVQRRTVADDNRGVGEAMNETVGGVTPYPPYGDAKRRGEGVVIKGKHRILVGKGGASLARSQMDQAFSEPMVFVASSPRGSAVPFKQTSFSALRDALPDNVMLVTFALLSESTFLVRLGHQYAAGENATLSQAARVNMKELFAGVDIVSIKEKTLSANQDWSDWEKRRLDWDGDSKLYKRGERSTMSTSESLEVVLKAMEIRTFEVQIAPTRID